MFGRRGNRRLVLALDAAAHAGGLYTGMPASKAQLLVPELISIELDAAEDDAALERLALWALRYAPLVGVGTRTVPSDTRPLSTKDSYG